MSRLPKPYVPRPGSGVERMIAILRTMPPGSSVPLRELMARAVSREYAEAGNLAHRLSGAVKAGVIAIDKSIPRYHRVRLGPELPSDAAPPPAPLTESWEPVHRVVPAHCARPVKTRGVRSVFELGKGK